MRKNFSKIDIFAANNGKAAPDNSTNSTFDTAEHIKVKQVYTAEDTKNMEHLDYADSHPFCVAPTP